MSTATQKPQKLCRVCGVDCAGKERYKDASGLYTCAACHKKAQDRGPIPLEPIAGESPLAAANGSLLDDWTPPAVTNCPKCKAMRSPGQTVCVKCGHNNSPPDRVVTVKLKASKKRKKKVDDDHKVKGEPGGWGGIIAAVIILGGIVAIFYANGGSGSAGGVGGGAAAAILLVRIGLRLALASRD